jgi:hypothetical protein
MRFGPIFVVLTALGGCVTQKDIDAARHFQNTIPTCSGEKDCEFKWAAARRWMLSNPTMKLEHYAVDLMETYNPTGDGLAARVVKEPVDETPYRLVVDVWCSGFACLNSLTQVRQSFNDYVSGKVAIPTPPPSAPEKRGTRNPSQQR